MLMKIIFEENGTNGHLSIDEFGVEFSVTSPGGTFRRRHPFNAVECVLLSPAGRLSFQVGSEVFSAPVSLDNALHRACIDGFVREVYCARNGGVIHVLATSR